MSIVYTNFTASGFFVWNKTKSINHKVHIDKMFKSNPYVCNLNTLTYNTIISILLLEYYKNAYRILLTWIDTKTAVQFTTHLYTYRCNYASNQLNLEAEQIHLELFCVWIKYIHLSIHQYYATVCININCSSRTF